MLRKIAMAAAVCLLALSTARADFFLFTVGNTNITGNNSVSSPYADLNVTGNTITGVVQFNITLHSPNVGQFGQFGFNLASTISKNDFNLGSGPSGWTLDKSPNASLDGFGKFDLVLGPSSNNQRVNSLSFTLQFNSTNHLEALASNFEETNSGAGNPPGSFYFAVDFFPGTGLTGDIGVPSRGITQEPLPAPPSAMLAVFGVASCGLAGLRRFRVTKS